MSRDRDLQRRERLLAVLDAWTLKMGPLNPEAPGVGVMPAVPVRLLEPMWRACVAAVADGTATPEVVELVDDPDCWAAATYGRAA